MKIKVALLVVASCAFAAAAQTVTVTPKKVTYRRHKPMQDFKRTFTITYPKVKAATPALSRKIENAISYANVLKLDLTGELGPYQWLEEADYKVKYNKNGILCVELWMEGSGAYPSGTTKVAVVDTRTGSRARPVDVFTDLKGLAAMVRKDQLKEIKDGMERIKKEDPEGPGNLFDEADFKAKDLDWYEVSDKGVTFFYDYGFPHVIQALQPDGQFFYDWQQLRPYIKASGLLSRIAR